MLYYSPAMEPRIQYAQTKDGVSIAFWTLGEGVPFIVMPRTPLSHAQMDWQIPEYRRWYERLAEKRRLVRYDGRGFGLSDRKVDDFSLDAQVRDLEAVAGYLGTDTFDLWGYTHTGPVAIAYAARHPEHVAHLVLWLAWVRSSDVFQSPVFDGLLALLERDWDFFTETAAHIFFDWASTESPRQFAAYMRECVTADAARGAYRAMQDIDVTNLLEQVTVPTLVLHVRQVPYPGADVARELAAHIPDARLAVLEGRWMAPFQNDMEAVAQAIDEFLSEGEEPSEQKGSLPEGTAIILFLDIAESTSLTEQLGDAAFRARARELDASLRATIKDAGGTPVEGKVLGDGVMAVFTSARQAIDCALRCAAHGNDAGLPLHLGIHAGDVTREGNNVYGGAVNVAARVAGTSAPGEILVSDTVRSLARTSADVTFEDRGEQVLKGIAEPQRLFAVQGQ